MYESFYGLKEKPFSLLPDPAYLYLSKQHEMAISLLEYSLENQAGFCVITGKAGTGKTTLVRYLLNQVEGNVSVGLISNIHHSFGELLRWILQAFNLEAPEKNRAQLHQIFVDYLIEQYAKNRRTMLIIDEAQNMSADSLEELRMLSNINSEKDLVLQVILVGQPPLREILQRPDLEQFAQRVAVDYHLESLSREETHGYIHHRIKVAGGEHDLFTDDACDAVFEHTGGIPRLINLLCDYSLVYAYADHGAVVTGELVEQVVSEREKDGSLAIFSKQPHATQHLTVDTAGPTVVAKTANTLVAARGAGNTLGSTSVHDVRGVIAIDGRGKSQRAVFAIPGRNPDYVRNVSAARHNQEMVGKHGQGEIVSRMDRYEHGISAAYFEQSLPQGEIEPVSNPPIVAPVESAATPVESAATPVESAATPVDMSVISLSRRTYFRRQQRQERRTARDRRISKLELNRRTTGDNPSLAATQGTAKKQARATGSLQKNEPPAPSPKQYLIAIVLIGLLVSAAVIWRYLY